MSEHFVPADQGQPTPAEETVLGEGAAAVPEEAPVADTEADTEAGDAAPVEYGHAGIEYAIFLRPAGGDWALHHEEVFIDRDVALAALGEIQADLEHKTRTMWDVLANTPDENFAAVAADLQRARGAEAALFARAVSAFVHAS